MLVPHRHTLLALSAALLLAACGGSDSDDAPTPPVPPEPPPPKLAYPLTPTVNVSEDHFGRTVADPYRWLEDIHGASTEAWVQAQNQFTADYITRLPDYAAVQSRIQQWFTPPSGSQRGRVRSLDERQREQILVEGVEDESGRYYFQYQRRINRDQRRPGDAEQASVDNVIYVARSADAIDQAEVLVDLNQRAADPDDHILLGGHQISADGQYLVYAMTRNFSDLSTLHVLGLGTSDERPSPNDNPIREIPAVPGGQFLLNGDWLYYVQPTQAIDDHVAPFSPQTLHAWQLGSPGVGTPWFTGAPAEGIAAFAIEGRWLYLTRTSSMQTALARLDLDQPTTPPQTVLDQRAAQVTFEVLGPEGDTQRLLVKTNDDAGLFRLVSIDPEHPDRADWQERLPRSAPGVTEYVHEIIACGTGYYAELLDQGSSRLTYFPGTESQLPRHDLNLPGLGAVSGLRCANDPGNPDGLSFDFSTLTQPWVVYSHDPATATTTAQFHQTIAGYQPDAYEMRRISVTSADGTPINVYLAHRKGLPATGDAPTLLYTYGGFGVPITPNFDPKAVPLLESGGIYAVVQARGGVENGNAWYQGGRLMHKQNTYDDVAAAARGLIDLGLTQPARLALEGESNGGLTTAAVSQQHPELFSVVFPTVGVLDLVRYDQFTGGFYWHDDFGRPQVQAEFDNLMQFSPLHQVRAQAYAPTYVFTGKTDGRVMPAHSYKFAATLQNVATGPNPYLLYAFPKNGHSLELHQHEFLTYLWTAFFHHTGVRYSAPAP